MLVRGIVANTSEGAPAETGELFVTVILDFTNDLSLSCGLDLTFELEVLVKLDLTGVLELTNGLDLTLELSLVSVLDLSGTILELTADLELTNATIAVALVLVAPGVLAVFGGTSGLVVTLLVRTVAIVEALDAVGVVVVAIVAVTLVVALVLTVALVAVTSVVAIAEASNIASVVSVVGVVLVDATLIPLVGGGVTVPDLVVVDSAKVGVVTLVVLEI